MAVAVAHQMDAALAVVHRFLTIQPDVQIQALAAPATHTTIVMRDVAIIKLPVILLFLMECWLYAGAIILFVQIFV
jgi:hypothetical protein